MPPFQRRRYYYRNWWNAGRRRRYFRRRRFGKTFFKRKRRRRRVRRKYFHKFKKYKKIKLSQWQPSSIKKCRIEGYLPLFQAGFGRFGNNYALWKESIFPEHWPGGGGWSIQTLSLGNLFTQHKEHMNYWTRSNNRMNLCRYMGAIITLFREPTTDYVFSYFDAMPKTVSKYFYSSQHPMRQLTYKRKKVVPSFLTQPHKRKPYKKLYIPPPRIMKNQWFFQQHLADYSLVTFVATACSLTGMFGSKNLQSNNATLYCIDTAFFKTPHFQYRTATTPQWGYRETDQQYLYGLLHELEDFNSNKWQQAIYLGNTMHNQSGSILDNIKPEEQEKKYKFSDWGNPFYWTYTTGHQTTFLTSKSPKEALKLANQNKTLGDSESGTVTKRENPYVFTVRYNPFKDKGYGNQLYLVPNYDNDIKKWEPTSDTDILFTDYPLWLMGWGLEDILKRMGKCRDIDNDWTLVFKCSYLEPKEQYYVPVSYEFIHGQGPYDTPREDISGFDEVKWYPKFKFQRQSLNNIIMTGPAVANADNGKNIQAKIKYNFLFKWGGNSAPQESVYDPTQQPITPVPSDLQFQNEIINPATSITTEIYPWDFRRDLLTTKATKRITESEPNEITLFTDGKQTSTDWVCWQTTPQTQKTPETQEEEILQQLIQLQQYNNQLQQRLRQLKQLSMDP